MEMEVFKTPYDYVIPTLWSHIGYMYGKCARQLHYANQERRIGYSKHDKEAIQHGKEIHEIIEEYVKKIFPDMQFKSEDKFLRDIPKLEGIKRVGAKLDLYTDTMVIEVKPIYTRTAYYQIAVEKFVNPSKEFRVLQYLRLINKSWVDQSGHTIITPVKADYPMARVFVGRIITALTYLPPRIDKALYIKYPCIQCIFRQRCYDEPNGRWEDFGIRSQYYINQLVLSDKQMIKNGFKLDA